MSSRKIRNIAVIAHVDHGKTSLVDQMLKQSGIFRENLEVADRVMDSDDLEKERGITILSKNTAIFYKDYKINIIDTPGHADFGGEVERVLSMADGAVLVVDAFEGPMPQTRFVLKNALDLHLNIVVCINKIDRPDARIAEVEDEILELMLDLDASEEQLNKQFVYSSAKLAYASLDPSIKTSNMDALFEAIIDSVPAPHSDEKKEAQLLISALDYSDYLGKIGIGKIENGNLELGKEYFVVNYHRPNEQHKMKITKLYEFYGLKKVEITTGACGDIIAISGYENIEIGDTITSTNPPQALKFSKISEPTIAMYFSVNDSPFAGREGKFVTTRQLRERLFKELNTDLSLRVEDTDKNDVFKVSGRGELHLSILIENMRREGFEFQVSKPEVLFRHENGQKLEPMEEIFVEIDEKYMGYVIESLSERKAELVNIKPMGALNRLQFLAPARALIAYRGEFMTNTHGTGILHSIFSGYSPYKGDIISRRQGSMIAFETGVAVSYGLMKAEERGRLFVSPGEEVYAGMVVGICSKSEDMEINICKRKQLSNMRAAGSDDLIKLTPPLQLSLEQALEFIADDELLEITPTHKRIRKKILQAQERMKAKRKKE